MKSQLDTKPAIIGGSKGGKGGGGGGRAPVEAPDSLRSKAYAQVLMAVCEGEVEGLVNGLKSVYLDGTPIQNEDGSYNFSGFSVDSRNGTQDQAHIPLVPDVESTIDVSVEVTAASPVVRTITDANIDEARVIIGIPQLSSQDSSTGDINGTTVKLAIDLQANGGGYVEVMAVEITGKKTSKYQSDYRIPLTGSAPWDIRVRRVTADSSSALLQNKTTVDQIVQIVNSKLRYPNTALLAARLDSSQFQSIPVISAEWYLQRIRVPSNYNAATRAYTGTWDGTFQIAWSDNPAWVLYDLLTTERYGCGHYVPEAALDKWAFYTASKYCDEMVPDGFGGQEPRFTCNFYLQERAEAYSVIRDLSSIFRAMPYWQTGAITITQDAPADPVAIYNQANVLDGKFTYSGSALKTRHTVALVSWNDPQDGYKRKVEYVEDTDGIAKYGVIETEVIAVGCISRGQAHRVGKWLLNSELLETETVTFKTGLDTVYVQPGNIILVADQKRAGARMGGRVVSASGVNITLDTAPSLVTGAPFTFTAILPNGVAESRTVASYAGNTIQLASPMTRDPIAGAVWVIEKTNLNAQKFRVVSVIETPDGQYEITGLKHVPEKYGYVEQGIAFQPAQTSLLNQQPASPTGLDVTESLYETSTDVRVLINIDWADIEGAAVYEVTYRRDGGNFVTLPPTAASAIDIRDAQPGDYYFTVTAISLGGLKSKLVIVEKTIYGKTNPPSDVANLSAAVLDRNTVLLSWTLTPDLDVKIGGRVRFRYSPLTSGALWQNAVDIGTPISGASTSHTFPLVNGTYLAKFVDSDGNESVNAISVNIGSANIVNMNVVQAITENPSFSGVKTYAGYDGALGGIKLASGTLWDSIPGNIDTWVDLDNVDGVPASGTYDFASTFDLGAVYTSRLSVAITAAGYSVIGLVDNLSASIDDWVTFDGEAVSDVDAKVYVRTTQDNPSGSPVWSVWQPLFAGDYVARAFQFQCRMTSENPQHNIVVQALSVTVDMPDRTEGQNNLSSGAGAYAVTFPSAFRAIPNLGITANNMASGDYYQITGLTNSGFTITFYNSAGTAINRTFSYVAEGYGRAS